MSESTSKLVWMMWMETNPKNTPSQTLMEACQYFMNKYGRMPTHARVPINWPDLNGNAPAEMQIERTRNILPHHIHLAADPAGDGEGTNTLGEPI